ncbi:MAG: hypothetical protein P8177_08560 [Gemmatimonadota bacterium]|jgi:hypothetical protein
MFFRRGVSENDRFLQAKLWIFGAGAIVALIGMGLQNDWLIGIAGLILAAGIALRFLEGSSSKEKDDGPDAWSGREEGRG